MAKARKKKQKPDRKLLIGGLLAAVVLLALFTKVWSWLSDNRIPNFRKEAVVFVRPETGVDEVYGTLINEAGVKRPYSLDRAFKAKKVAENLQPGRYLIKPGYTSVYVARMLNNGWQTPARLTLSGTLRKKSDLAAKISRQLMIDSAEVIRALNDRAMLSAYGFTPQDIFSLFIPDTYEMYWTASVDDIFARQKKAWDAFWTEDNVVKAKRLGLSKLQVSILASIVKGESNLPKDYPKLAGVYINRLKKGMKLQACPTVAFLLNYETTRILNKDLRIDSPYNTYMYAGLPPGPIAVPGKEYLNAVLNPDTASGYLFFCADPSFDGSHRFARTYSEHMKNSRDYQKALAARGK